MSVHPRTEASVRDGRPQEAPNHEAGKKSSVADKVADALAGDFPKSRGSTSGTTTGYSVEARYTYHEPKVVAGALLDNRWRELHFPEGQPGVPAVCRHHTELLHTRLMEYQAAQALRWWFLANAAADGFTGTLCVETRLVEHSVEYTSKTQALKAVAYIGSENRSDMMADWGKLLADGGGTPSTTDASLSPGRNI